MTASHREYLLLGFICLGLSLVAGIAVAVDWPR
jgi:hypothetical protein